MNDMCEGPIETSPCLYARNIQSYSRPVQQHPLKGIASRVIISRSASRRIAGYKPVRRERLYLLVDRLIR